MREEFKCQVRVNRAYVPRMTVILKMIQVAVLIKIVTRVTTSL